MLYNYTQILTVLPFPIDLYEEYEFIHFQTIDLKSGSLLIEERVDRVIIWHNDLQLTDYSLLYETINKELSVPIYVVYIDTEKEHKAVIQNSGVHTDFNEECYPNKYGSFILTKTTSN